MKLPSQFTPIIINIVIDHSDFHKEIINNAFGYACAVCGYTLIEKRLKKLLTNTMIFYKL